MTSTTSSSLPLLPPSLDLQALAFKDNNRWRAHEVEVSYNGWHPVGYEYAFGTAEEMGMVPARGDDVDYLNVFNMICRGFTFAACLRMSAQDALWCHVAEVMQAVIIDLLETLLSRGKWPEQLKFHTTTHARLSGCCKGVVVYSMEAGEYMRVNLALAPN
ncbi:hypothetical protein BDQ17DRAFT_1492724 [Cyathus striatus]|nr:hypothetical protein BDQ17DRAFT_1492724 [Cyathus striatus]